MIKKLILGVISAGIVVVGYFGFYLQSNNGIGVDLPEAPALFETSLAAPISATATTIPLTSIIVRGNEELANYNCFTIDEGSSQAEFVCGTISTSTRSLINASRGVSAKNGFTENAALQFAHRRGASVKVTDFPIIQLMRSQNNGDEAFENVLKYAPGVSPSGANELADVGYVLSVVTGGSVSFDGLTVAGTAGETITAGQVVYFKTTDQQWYKVSSATSTTYASVLLGIAQGSGVDEGGIAGGVLLNGVDANQTGLTAGNQYYISTTPGQATSTVGALSLGIAQSTSELIFDRIFSTPTLRGNNTFSGNNTFTGTTTFSGNITGHASSTIRTYTASSTWTKPAGLEYIIVEGVGGGGGSGYAFDFDNNDQDGSASGGTGGYFKKIIPAANLASSETVTIGVGGIAGISGAVPGGTGGTTIFGTHASSTGGTGSNGEGPGSGGTASGGDLNFNGNNGYTGGTDSGDNGSSNCIFAARTNSFLGQYGSGGSGACDSNGTAGTAGIVIVTEFY